MLNGFPSEVDVSQMKIVVLGFVFDRTGAFSIFLCAGTAAYSGQFPIIFDFYLS
jgi:hypothetical protein